MKNLSTNTAEFSSIKAGDGNGLHLQDDGGNGIFIKDGGDVGIGTTNPVNLLHIKGPNDTSFDNINNIYSEGTDAYDSQNAGGGIQFGGKYTAGGSSTVFAQISGIKENTTDGDYKGALTFGARDGSSTNMEAMRINSSGNVGIGTTNPGYKLEVYQDLNASDIGTSILTVTNTRVNTGSGSATIGFITNEVDANTADKRAQISASYDGTNGGKLVLSTHNGTSLNQALTIKNNGNVGIGTTNPGEILVIQNSSNPTLQIRDGDAGSASPRTAGALHLGESATLGVAIENYTHNFNDVCSMIFKTTPAEGSLTERMRISTNGNVGIGTTNPSVAKLDVWQAETSSDSCIKTVRPGTADRKHIAFYNDNGSVGTIKTNGSTTSYNTTSDYRLKTDVQPMIGATERLKALKPVNFEWIADGTRVDGFIAHEVQEIVPEAISGEKDEEDENGNIVPQGIDQGKLVPLLTAAIQEQQQIIEDLKSQNESLAARITALEG